MTPRSHLFLVGSIDIAEQQQKAAEERLKGGGGGGTSGGVTDDWKAHVDVQLKQLREDVQQLRNWIVAAIAGPMLAIIGLYIYTGSKFDAVESRIVGVEAKFDAKFTANAVEQAKMNAKLDLLLERTSPKIR